MKIIEALKKTKDLSKKADDLKAKIAKYCADLDCETPIYPDQRGQVSEWLQSHGDVVKEILLLRYRIQKTNVNTQVTMRLGDKNVTKSIAEWIHRRKDLANMEMGCWKQLTERNLNETYKSQPTPNSPESFIKRRLYFDPKERDQKIELFRSEPSTIDGILETVNSTTDLME
jgi:hypothetical protein